MTNNVYVHGGLAQLLLDFLIEHKIDLSPLKTELARVKPFDRVHIEDWWGWLETIQRRVPQHGLGLIIGQHARTHHIGLLGYLVRSCATFGEAFQQFRRFQPLLHNLNPINVRVEGDKIRIGWDPDYGLSIQISNEVLVSAFVTFIHSLTQESQPFVLQIEFPRPATSPSFDYSAVTNCPVTFSAASLGIWIPGSVMQRPIPTFDPHLRDLLVAQAEYLMEATPQPDPFIKALHTAIIKELHNGEISSSHIAKSMRIPLRTFYRRLDQSGISFGKDLRTIRNRMSKQLLRDTQLSLVEISASLGYADQSSFGRAFKQWNGCSPMTYRNSSKNKVT